MVGLLRKERMRMNKKKISRERERCGIQVDGVVLRDTDSFSYLGVTVNSGGEMKQEIERKIEKFSRGVRQQYSILKNRHVPRKVKVLIYTTILRPVLMYGGGSVDTDH